MVLDLGEAGLLFQMMTTPLTERQGRQILKLLITRTKLGLTNPARISWKRVPYFGDPYTIALVAQIDTNLTGTLCRPSGPRGKDLFLTVAGVRIEPTGLVNRQRRLLKKLIRVAERQIRQEEKSPFRDFFVEPPKVSLETGKETLDTELVYGTLRVIEGGKAW